MPKFKMEPKVDPKRVVKALGATPAVVVSTKPLGIIDSYHILKTMVGTRQKGKGF